jgi:Ser/Thr protein kinase RdoA (MazF antagonist)
VTATARWLDADDERWLRTTVEKQSATVARHVSSSRETVCHGDLRLANAFFVDDAPTLFDLENLGVGAPVYDCACMWRRRVLENDFSVPKDWEFFKQGYEGVTQAGEEHWRLVPPLAVLRALWTMSLPALPGASWGEEWAHDPDYWRAHVRMVRWFAAVAESGESA